MATSSSFKKMSAWLVVGGVATYGIVKLKKLSNFSTQVQVDNNIRVLSHSYSILPPSISLTLGITPTISNPTDSSVKISQPYVQLTLSPTSPNIIGKSTPSGKMFIIPALGVMTFDPIIIPVNIGYENLAEVWNRFISTRTIGLWIFTKVYIGIFGGKVSVSKVDEKIQKF